MSAPTWLVILCKRLIEALITLVGLALLTFFLMKLLPGGPFDEEQSLHPEVRALYNEMWALDQPWPVQLLSYFRSLFSGNLGFSMTEPGVSVGELLSQNFANTLALNLLALAFIFCAGFALALLAADQPGSRVSRWIGHASVAFISLPSLFLGPLLIWIFALKLNLLPLAFLESPLHYILPVFTLSLRPTAYLVRILSQSLSETRQADYMRTAKAKGLSRGQALRRHALRNSLIPILSYAGPLIVGLLSGSFLVEILFATKGIGVLFAESLANRDLPVVLGLTLIYGGLLILVNMILDVLIRVADPRLREAT